MNPPLSKRSPRRYSALPGALAAVAALMVGTAVVPTQQVSGQESTAISREFVNPTDKKEKKKRAPALRKKARERWQWDRSGNAIDGAGNRRSAKRMRRRILMHLAGIPDTGRQWVYLRKILRREGPFLLTAHPLDLMRMQPVRFGGAR
jgi:hypothetical protein